VGAVVIVQQTPPNLFLSDKVLRLEMAEEDKPWMLWFLRSPDGRAAIEGAATGNQLSMRNLSQAALRKIEVPWPSAIERQAIIHNVEAAFAWIDRLAYEATSARKLIDHLDQAVLAKAFQGELVPQDPRDEPASVLLERIRTERAAAPTARSRGSSSAPKRKARAR
jgi:type I restriction enzyme S subunit